MIAVHRLVLAALEGAGADTLPRKRMGPFVAEWTHLADELERQPTVDEYAERWGASRTTAYALLTEMRELFPWAGDPSALVWKLCLDAALAR